MKVTGIIAEYNPFHKGHQYHIEQARQITDSDFCVVVMSGDFVQRGEPALFSKYLRTRMALTQGADLVLELPSIFAVSSAEDFAACGVSLLSALGGVDTICFGSEDGRIQNLQAAARLLSKEEEPFQTLLSQGLKEGLTWPQARNQAFITMNRENPGISLDTHHLNLLLGSPNNLLGIEYCKAILRQNSSLSPVTIQRQGQGYHDPSLEKGQASASALRQLLSQRKGEHNDLQMLPGEILSHIPSSLVPLYTKEPVITPEDLSELLNYALLTAIREGRDLTQYADLSEDLSHRLEHHLLRYQTWEGRIHQLKTRQYTYTRISRSLLHLVLGITKDEIRAGRKAGYAPYGRILGFKKESGALLSFLKQKTSIPLITKTAHGSKLLSGTALSMFHRDMYSSHLRQSIQAKKQAEPVCNEFTRPVCIL